MQKLIVGNWKMHGLSKEARALAAAIFPKENIVLCPPFTALGGVREATKLKLGGQDCSPEESGAFTGDISAAMLKDAGCAYVILGHSERRTHHKETSELVRKKAEAAHKAGLIAIICVGETEAERKAGKAKDVVKAQLLASIPAKANATDTVIAYEPVWAIGTGNTATAKDITEMHEFIQSASGYTALYGGSVKAGNAKEILAIASVGGVLVGGASLKAEEFNAIAGAA